MKSRNILPKKGTLFQFPLSYWWDIYSSDAMTEWEWILVNQITIVQAKVDCVILVFLSLAFRSETVNFSQQIRDVHFVNLQCCLAGSVWCHTHLICIQKEKKKTLLSSEHPLFVAKNLRWPLRSLQGPQSQFVPPTVYSWPVSKQFTSIFGKINSLFLSCWHNQL